MSFEINVSLNGTHFFATHARSCDSSLNLKKVLPVLLKKFPKKEGFEISVSYRPSVSYSTRDLSPDVNVDKLVDDLYSKD